MTNFSDTAPFGRYPAPTKPNVFVSYHHRHDQWYYEALSHNLGLPYCFMQDSSLDRIIDSESADYVLRRIREDYIAGSSCTIVLCGTETPVRKYVDWEIYATLQKRHGLVGVKLPSLSLIANGCSKPPRLQDNIDSGYAEWVWWEQVYNNPDALRRL
jgi:hypothetical protein